MSIPDKPCHQLARLAEEASRWPRQFRLTSRAEHEARVQSLIREVIDRGRLRFAGNMPERLEEIEEAAQDVQSAFARFLDLQFPRAQGRARVPSALAKEVGERLRHEARELDRLGWLVDREPPYHSSPSSWLAWDQARGLERFSGILAKALGMMGRALSWVATKAPPMASVTRMPPAWSRNLRDAYSDAAGFVELGIFGQISRSAGTPPAASASDDEKPSCWHECVFNDLYFFVLCLERKISAPKVLRVFQNQSPNGNLEVYLADLYQKLGHECVKVIEAWRAESPPADTAPLPSPIPAPSAVDAQSISNTIRPTDAALLLQAMLNRGCLPGSDTLSTRDAISHHADRKTADRMKRHWSKLKRLALYSGRDGRRGGVQLTPLGEEVARLLSVNNRQSNAG
jgi:hypothetical protein